MSDGWLWVILGVGLAIFVLAIEYGNAMWYRRDRSLAGQRREQESNPR
jgi:hypothetical protein